MEYEIGQRRRANNKEYRSKGIQAKIKQCVRKAKQCWDKIGRSAALRGFRRRALPRVWETERKEKEKRKKEIGSTKTRKSHGKKKEAETKVGESCNRSELINSFASHLGGLSALLTSIYCTQQVFGHRQTFVISFCWPLPACMSRRACGRPGW